MELWTLPFNWLSLYDGEAPGEKKQLSISCRQPWKCIYLATYSKMDQGCLKLGVSVLMLTMLSCTSFVFPRPMVDLMPTSFPSSCRHRVSYCSSSKEGIARESINMNALGGRWAFNRYPFLDHHPVTHYLTSPFKYVGSSIPARNLMFGYDTWEHWSKLALNIL